MAVLERDNDEEQDDGQHDGQAQSLDSAQPSGRSLRPRADGSPFPIDNLVMNWTDEREGPCDQVALWEQSSKPTSISGAKRDVFVSSWGSYYITTLNVDDANWIGYVDMFGKVISARKY